MGLFNKRNDGGMLNVIRCDETDYLVWKWSPNGLEGRRENAIRWGSTLRVKAGEVAVFVYPQDDGRQMDFIEGPVDTTLRTANFPVLAGLIGTAFGGDTPFQAEVYFINLAGTIPIDFYIPPFDVADPRYLDYAVPVWVRGQILVSIDDYKAFIAKHRMRQFDIEEFKADTKETIKRHVRSAVTNAPMKAQIPLLQIGRYVDTIAENVTASLRDLLRDDFGVSLKRAEIGEIELDKESRGYTDLYEATTAQATEIIKAHTQDTVERLRMGREVEFKRQNLGVETEYFAAHKLNRQADVAEIAAENIGELGSGSGDLGDKDVGGINPAAIMTGMMLGGAVGSNMANMMNGMMGGMQGATNPVYPQTPPPLTTMAYFVAENGQQTGPFMPDVVRQMVAQGRIVRETLVWRQGMTGWEQASAIAELAPLFNNVPPKL